MTQELLYYLLEQLKNADDVVLNSNSSQNQLIKYANNKVVNIKQWTSNNISVFVTKDKKILATTLKKFDEKSAKELAQKILKNIIKLPKNNDYFGIAKGPFKYSKIEDTYDKKLEDFNEEMIDIVKQSIDLSLKKSKRCAGTFEKNLDESILLTSNNVETREKTSNLYFSMRSLCDKESSGASTSVSRMLNKLEYENVAIKSSEIAKKATLPKKSITGKFDIIFEPLAFATIAADLVDAASIFSIEAGLSCLKNKLNKKIANEHVTLYDDATIPNGYASTSFDAEGTPTQKNTIIGKGILKTYLHNYSTSKRYKTKNTANAGLILPSPSNVYLKPGTYKQEELFSGIKKGLYITNVWYTRYQNYSTGDFSTIPRDGAFYIENGKIKYALKEIRISDNILNIAKNISKLSNKIEQIKSWEVSTPTFLPFVLVKNVNITRPE